MVENLPPIAKEVFERLGPAIVGTAVSMFFTQGEWKRRLAKGAIGVPFSFYLAPSVDAILDVFPLTAGIDQLGAGVLTAVFGLALVEYIFELSRQLNLGPIIREWIKEKFGVNGEKKDVKQSD